jgi:hypothetical protein
LGGRFEAVIYGHNHYFPDNLRNFAGVYNYEATHGHEITVKSWLNPFIGFDGTKTLRVGKEIDSIAGATISASGITDDIQVKTLILKSL